MAKPSSVKFERQPGIGLDETVADIAANSRENMAVTPIAVQEAYLAAGWFKKMILRRKHEFVSIDAGRTSSNRSSLRVRTQAGAGFEHIRI